MKKIYYFIISLVVITFLSKVIIDKHYKKYINSSINIKDKIIFIEKGKGLNQILSQLEKEKIIYNKFLFKLSILHEFKNKIQVKFGEYLFEKNITIKEIKNKILNGKTYLRTITFAEGLTTHTIIKILNENQYLSGDLINFKNIPEGSLLCETYTFNRGEKRQNIVNKMQEDLKSILKNEWLKRDNGLLYKNIYEVLIMASIIEKETGLDEERFLVSSVFHNRLKIDMKLETDTTSIYGFTKGDLSKEQNIKTHILLKQKSEYNTYKNKGLTPTPICNVGKKSIEATLHPANTDYIYFVATGYGGHSFSKSYEEHLKNITKLKKIIFK